MRPSAVADFKEAHTFDAQNSIGATTPRELKVGISSARQPLPAARVQPTAKEHGQVRGTLRVSNARKPLPAA
jgi:hypothetical protein